MCSEEDMMNKKSPCWDGYVQRGMKPGKNGKMVPNCVPVSEKKSLFSDLGKDYTKAQRQQYQVD